jgi:hypothetical protein
MTQQEIIDFVEKNHKNPSKHRVEEQSNVKLYQAQSKVAERWDDEAG